MDSQMHEILKEHSNLSPIPVETLTPEVARQLPELRSAVLAVLSNHLPKRLITGVVEHVAHVDHILIPGPDSQLLARVYRPTGSIPKPGLLYFHGGGFVLGNLETCDASCRSLANAADCIVVSVAYRLAPEHKFPAAHQDAFAAYKWLQRNAASIGIDPERIAVGGESAGANLATHVCIRAREKRLAQPLHQLLVYPVTNSNFNTFSYQDHADAQPLNKAMMKWFFEHYTNDSSELSSPLLFPFLVENLSNLAPATLITAEIDPLCSEGEAYAEKLASCGVPVHHQRFDGVTHEFFGMGAVLSEAKRAVKMAAEQLQMAFDGPLPESWTIIQQRIAATQGHYDL